MMRNDIELRAIQAISGFEGVGEYDTWIRSRFVDRKKKNGKVIPI